jgi:DNA-binding transcriptional LysR family regulator
MHFETLKIFCDVVRHRSFSHGASVNHVSQSAASQAIHQLEKRLGTILIDRSKRPWSLTFDGHYFFDRCHDIVERYLELEAGVKRRLEAAVYVIRVAAIYSVGLHDMSMYVDRFESVVAGARVQIDYIHPDRVYERVRSEQADLGLISFAKTSREFTTIPWREEEMVIACLPEHPLAGQTGLDAAVLSGEPFVRFDRGLPIRREIDRFLKRHEADVKVVAEFDNIPTMKQAVEDGAGIALLPEPTFRREVERDVLAVARLGGEAFSRPLSIIHRRKRKLSSSVQRFVDLLCGVGADLGEQTVAADGRERETESLDTGSSTSAV